MEEFVKAAQRGDDFAWNTIYRRHYPWMYAIALRICGNSEITKDAVQDAFIHAYGKLGQLKDPAAFAGWLKSILVRCCYRTSRYYSPPERILIEDARIWEDEMNETIDRYANQVKLYDALSELPEVLRSTLLLRYFSNWQSYEQMAVVLGVPVGTIRSRLNQARQKLVSHWTTNKMESELSFREAEAWNEFYNNCFGAVHSSLPERNKFLEHFDKDLELIFSSGKKASGRAWIEKVIDEDLQYGSGFGSIYVMSSGSISIVEVCNINSKEFPDRCPESGIFVLYRNKHQISRLSLHNSR